MPHRHTGVWQRGAASWPQGCGGHADPVTRPAAVYRVRRRWSGPLLAWLEVSTCSLHGHIEGQVLLAPEDVGPLTDQHLRATFESGRVVAIAVDTWQLLSIAVVIRVSTFAASGAAALSGPALLFGVPKCLALGAPSHRRGIRLHTVRRGAQPDLLRQLGCLEAWITTAINENKVSRHKDTVGNWSPVTQIQCLPVSNIQNMYFHQTMQPSSNSKSETWCLTSTETIRLIRDGTQTATVVILLFPTSMQN